MTVIHPYPLLCREILKPKIWGGSRLCEVCSEKLPSGQKIGEAWKVADLKEGVSFIANGPLSGNTIRQAVERWGSDLTGSAWTFQRFPLLVKFIEANENLSVQVHPSTEECRDQFPGDFGKDETWIVLASDGGKVFFGFQDGMTLETFDRCLAEGSIEKYLREVIVSPGDVLRIQPGTVHAMCSGVLILEIQQPSDSTFRIYDYGRLGEDGKPRPLHLNEARRVMHFDFKPDPFIRPQILSTLFGTHEILVDNSAYRIERAHLTKPHKWRIDPQSCQICVLIQGRATLKHDDMEIDLSAGDTVVLPASIKEASIHPMPEALTVFAGAGGIPLLED